MRKKIQRLFFFIATIISCQSAHAYKYVIFTDEVDTNVAEEVADLMKTTYPFNQFKIEVEIVRVSPEDLDCQSQFGIDRNVGCKNEVSIQEKAMKMGADQAMVVKNLPKWGGSSGLGSGVPVITNNTTPRAMIHEYMHTLGICDEYEYPADEAMIYCNEVKNSPNLAFIVPLNSYRDDAYARSRHGREIPWFSDILPTTLITTSGFVLGTGDVDFTSKAPVNITNMPLLLEAPTGLYRGKICNQANPPIFSWHPGSVSSIMGDMSAGLGAPLEKIVEKLLVSKGMRKKFEEPETREVKKSIVADETIKGSEVSVTPTPEEVIDNSGRSFFKSFIKWLGELFNGIGKAIGR